MSPVLPDYDALPTRGEIDHCAWGVFGDDDQVGLERPTAVKFDPRDGSMYIVDFGRMRMKGGRERVSAHTGRIFKLRVRPGDPSTQPATAPTTGEGGAGTSPAARTGAGTAPAGAAVGDTTPASARR